MVHPTRFELVASAFGAIEPALRSSPTGFAPMCHATIITKQIENPARPAYSRTRSDLRPAPYVVFTREGRRKAAFRLSGHGATVCTPRFFPTTEGPPRLARPEYATRLVVRADWPGAIWLSAVAVNAIAVPLVLGLRLRPERQASLE